MTLQKIYDQTVALERLIDQYDREKRDGWIGKLQELLDARGRLVEQLSGPRSNKERAVVEKIVAVNQKIGEGLQSIKMDILKDMHQFRMRKHTVSRYRNPYTGPTKDGMFLDKRE
ncbi:hypothetical protein EWH99_04625 [Sporolactobacillus sp. THM7-7]|nr:hypothetical protein EWH99_04625 [Sporolactobacillus sp. THM7-7]